MEASNRRMMELSPEECRDLLGAHRIGRIAIVDPSGRLDVLPVNYTAHEDVVLFRTHGGLTLHAVLAGPLTFEVDDFDWSHHTGWSVLIHGSATVLRRSPGDDDSPDDGEPWAPGEHPLVVRIEPESVTGRRIVLLQEQLDPRGYL
jgi:hypothetical protein